eukprot:1038579-Karenia_brevis.AAC.1
MPGKRTNKIPTAIKDEEEGREDDEMDDDEDFSVQVEQDEADEETDIRKPDMQSKECMPRAMGIKKADIDRYGPTKGCYGCRAIMEKWSSIQAHAHHCRQRISEAMMNDAIDRRR